jgi:hypothetical protein
MPELPETSQEKPVYETPVIVDLNAIQRGEGGFPPGTCTAGSTPTGDCVAGSLVV